MTTQLIENLQAMERTAEQYRSNQSDTIQNKLKWRARHARHALHVLPKEQVLEIGSGSGIWTEKLAREFKNELQITAACFNEDLAAKLREKDIPATSVVTISDFATLPDESFDYVIGATTLCHDRYAELLVEIYRVLKPSGQFIFFEDNSWNTQLRLKRFFPSLSGMLPYPSCKIAIPQYKFMKNASQLGFSHLDITPWDLLPSFLPDAMTKFLANKVYALEHAPFIKNLCGTVSMWGRKPGDEEKRRPDVNLASHQELFNSVSVVLPCHNESMNLPPFIDRLRKLYGDYLYEIIIVNDNSTDSTAEVADAMAKQDPRVKVIHRRPPNGVGRALKDGYEFASGRYILSMDCDFILILSELRDMFDAIAEGYDGAIGSRFSHNSLILNYPFTKIVGNRAVHFLIKLAFPTIRDISNNLKLYKAEVFKTIKIEEPHFAANLETGLKPLIAGFRIKEVPISWIDRSINMGSSSFKVFKVGPAYFSALWNMLKNRERKSTKTVEAING